MTTVTLSKTAQTALDTRNDYSDGYFDAATHAAPAKTTGAYFDGYMAYTRETGNAPF
jgi:hypothetical protein